MENIYLVGFMGTGKTVVGKILAQRLNREFVEMDEIIELQEGSKIIDIFAEKGEKYFRKLEKDLLQELSLKEDLIISCGGGLVCDEENRVRLKNSGTVFSLTAGAETIYKRTTGYAHRPLLNVDNPLEKIESLLKARSPFYNQAHYAIDTEEISPDDVADKIIKILNDIRNTNDDIRKHG